MRLHRPIGRILAAAFGLCAGTFPAAAASSAWIGTPRAAVRLVSGVETAATGAPIPAGVAFRLADGWHAYWRTPGDAGIAPHFDWSGSQNVADVAIAWPAPQRLEVSGLQNAVYTGQLILPLTVTRRDPSTAARLVLGLDYAVCGPICVPVHADLSLALPAGDGAAAPEAPDLAEAQAAVPGSPALADRAVRRLDVEVAGGTRRLTLEIDSHATPFRHPDLFVEDADGSLAGAPDVTLGDGGRSATLRVALPEGAGERPRLTLVDDGRATEIPFAPVPTTPAGQPYGLPAILGIALLGGLVLNLMPCVLPVLAIKLSGVMRHAGRQRSEIRLGFGLTACGVVASFLALALLPIGLRLAGATVGWGIQFQQPWFLAALAVMTTLFAASLFDWLPIGFPAFAARLGQTRGGSARAEAVLAGVAATLLATPCSAPFVGTAVGFALARGPGEILAVFASLGLGMALPFLLVAAWPGLVAWLPRPGRWMLRVRQGLGLVLLGTAGWLVFVLASVAGIREAVTLLLLLACLLLLWTPGARWPGPRGIATAAVAAMAVALAGFAPVPPAAPATVDTWTAFDPMVIDQAVAAGRTVLVDVTARWCLTCKVNDLSTFERRDVRDRLQGMGTLRMRADWSRPDPAVAAYLQRFGRFGIPFDIVYGPGSPAGEPLPELLTPAILLATIDRAVGSAAETR